MKELILKKLTSVSFRGKVQRLLETKYGLKYPLDMHIQGDIENIIKDTISKIKQNG